MFELIHCDIIYTYIVASYLYAACIYIATVYLAVTLGKPLVKERRLSNVSYNQHISSYKI